MFRCLLKLFLQQYSNKKNNKLYFLKFLNRFIVVLSIHLNFINFVISVLDRNVSQIFGGSRGFLVQVRVQKIGKLTRGAVEQITKCLSRASP